MWGTQEFALKKVGHRATDDKAAMDVSDYLAPPLKIPRMGEKSLDRMKRCARGARGRLM